MEQYNKQQNSPSLLKTFVIECEHAYTEQQSAITQQLNELFGSVGIGTELIEITKEYLTAQYTSFDSYTAQLASRNNNRSKCKVRYGGNNSDAVYYRCYSCSEGGEDGVVVCSSCFERGIHKMDSHAFTEETYTAEAAAQTVLCECGNASRMKASGWCSQHINALQQTATGTVEQAAVRTTPETASVQRIMPRLIARILLQLRLYDNDRQAATLIDFVVQLANNDIVISVVWNVLCDEKWYSDVFGDDTTSSNAATTRNTVACALMNAQQDEICCVRLKELQLRIKAALGRTDGSDSELESIWQLEQKCALDEVIFWLIRLGLNKSLEKLLRTYCGTKTNTNVLCAKYEVRRAFSRQSVLLSVGVYGLLHSNSDSALYTYDFLHDLHSRFCDFLCFLFNVGQVALEAAETLSFGSKLLCDLQFTLKRLFGLKRCEVTVPRKSPALSSKSESFSAPMNLKLESEHQTLCLYETLIAVNFPAQLLSSTAGDLSIEQVKIAELLPIIELFQGLKVCTTENQTQLVSDVSDKEDVVIILTIIALSCGIVRSVTSDERRLKVAKQAIETTRNALVKWLIGIGVQYDQSVEQVDSITLPSQLTYNIPLHRTLALLLLTYVNLEFSGLERKQLLSATDCYYIVQHAVSTLCGDVEVRNGLWGRSCQSLLECSHAYCNILQTDRKLTLDLALIQYCAAQSNADRFLVLLVDRALHSASVLSYSSGQYEADSKEMSCLFESLAKVLTWIVQPSWLTFLHGDHRTKRISQLLIVALSQSDCITYALLELQLKMCNVISRLRVEEVARVIEAVSSASPSKNGSRTFKSALWLTDFDYVYYMLFCANRTQSNITVQSYLSQAGSAEDRDDAARRGVTVDTVWPPMPVPSVELLSAVPASFKPSNLPRSSTYYALVFAMLTRAINVGVTHSSVHELTMFAVQLVRTAVAYYEFDCTLSATALGVANIKLDDVRTTRVDNVNELALDTWYPAEICNNVYACVLHIISTVRMANQTDKCVAVNQSILTLLVEAYKTYAQEDYSVPNAGASLKRRELFATGADVIGALLDTLCNKSESIRNWLDDGAERGLAGARLLNKSANKADNVEEPPPPPPSLSFLKKVKLTPVKYN